MYGIESDALNTYLKTSSSIKTQPVVIAEWNLNSADNIYEIGNYRYRPNVASPTESNFGIIRSSFVKEDSSTVGPYYYGATDSQVVTNSGFATTGTSTGEPIFSLSTKDKNKLLFSLEECFGRFRPRSGINKLVWYPNDYFASDAGPNLFLRPRYYLADKDDKFKYWTSYRTEATTKLSSPIAITNASGNGTKATFTVAAADISKISVNDVVYIYGIKTKDAVEPSALSNGYNISAIVTDVNSGAYTFSVLSNETATYVSGGFITFDKTLIERGISKNYSGTYYIDDAAPFVVYNSTIPTNKIVVKMQTHIGNIDLSSQFKDLSGSISDPFYGNSNKAVPKVWKIQYLDSQNVWQNTGVSLDETSVNYDGYLELIYGLVIPSQPTAIYIGEVYSYSNLPAVAPLGYTYLVRESSTEKGTMYTAAGLDGNNQQIWNTTTTFSYTWKLSDQSVGNQTNFVTNLTSPKYYVESGTNIYQEFQLIKGLRIVVDSMNINDSTFDLIELSPRLAADLSDRTISFSVKKDASDIGVSGMPVGQLLASTGTLTMFDFDQAFNKNNSFNQSTNTGSIISSFSTKNLQVKLYENIIDNNNNEYYIPIKTLYSEGFPESNNSDRNVSINLRDMFFYLESLNAPQLLIPDVSLSFAVATLMDSIGFSNYVFKRTYQTDSAGNLITDSSGNYVVEADPVIPYFYVGPDTTVARVLEDLATATQTAIFFDEDNNLVFMSKNYMMPNEAQRATNATIYGTLDQSDTGVIKNGSLSQAHLTNIVNIASQNTEVFNDGKIIYDTKYIQKSYSSIRQAQLLDSDKTWIYKPVLLWEVSDVENARARNQENSSNNYTLSAIPLNSDLSTSIPRVETVNGINVLKNNTIDLGEAVYFLTRYNGYFSANGEIIKYDAVQYSITGVGTVWITDIAEYQRYFSSLVFNGKMYPTGLIRIYAEPYYEKYSGVVTTTASGTSGQYTISVSSNSGLIVGMLVSGTGIGATAIIKNINGTTITLSVANSGTVSGTITFTLKSPFRMKVGDVAKHGRGQFGTTIAYHYAGIGSSHWSQSNVGGVFINSYGIFNSSTTYPTQGSSGKYRYSDASTSDIAGLKSSIDIASRSTRNGIIKNFLSTSTTSESIVNTLKSTEQNPGTLQSSALIFNGPSLRVNEGNPIDFISYTYNVLPYKYTHFGSRLRIVGNPVVGSTTSQLPTGAFAIYSAVGKDSQTDKPTIIAGSSGGIAMMLDTKININSGYYFEITALTEDPSSYDAESPISNVFFYKLQKNGFYDVKVLSSTGTISKNNGILTITGTDALPSSATVGKRIWISFSNDTNGYNGYYIVTSKTSNTAWTLTLDDISIPVTLWSGETQILVDDGLFTGQSRSMAEKNPTVYDLAMEYSDSQDKKTRTFYLYINNKVVATVVDNNPLPITPNHGLFVRGSSRLMFENVYALSTNYSQNTSLSLDAPANSIFTNSENISVSDSFGKYSISNIVQSSYLSGLNSSDTPQYNIYYEEFGTIMRECAYFNIRYDKAYPALIAKLAPTFNDMKGYSVSGFTADAYGAQFLIFNNTDTALILDETGGNYLRILGISFTNESQEEYTVDDYFARKTDLSQNTSFSSIDLTDPTQPSKAYIDVKNSRNTYGKKSFTLSSPYIQSQDVAKDLMGWIISKIMKPRRSVGIELFGLPTIQLGDIVKIDYTNELGVKEISPDESRFVVYSIEYNRDSEGPSTNVYLNEVR